MAFTLSHMAAALPFYRCQRWMSFEAVLLGSMLPDLPYFLNSPISVSDESHGWAGLFSYCLPYGLVILILWYGLLKPAAIAVVQPWFPFLIARGRSHQHFSQWLKFGVTVVLGLLLGASTHLMWDGITHLDGFIARHVVVLQLPVNSGYFGTMPLARVLQYGTSLAGLGWVGWFIVTQMRNMAFHKTVLEDIPIIVLKKWHSLLIVILMCTGSLFWGLQAMLKWHSLWVTNTYLFLAKLLVGLLQGAASLFIIYALIYHILYWFCKQKQYSGR